MEKPKILKVKVTFFAGHRFCRLDTPGETQAREERVSRISSLCSLSAVHFGDTNQESSPRATKCEVGEVLTKKESVSLEYVLVVTY